MRRISSMASSGSGHHGPARRLCPCASSLPATGGRSEWNWRSRARPNDAESAWQLGEALDRGIGLQVAEARRTIAIAREDRLDAGGARGEHVVAMIADHDRVVR